MQKDADFSQVQVLKVDGGASNNDLLMQMQADALQVSPVDTSQALHFLKTRFWHKSQSMFWLQATSTDSLF